MFNIVNKAKFIGVFNSEDFSMNIDEQTKACGPFESENNKNLMVSIGFCIENNYFSKQMTKYIKENFNSIEKKLNKLEKSYFDKAIKEILESDAKKLLPFREHIRRIIKRDNGTKKIYEECKKYIKFQFFTIHIKEYSAQLLFGIEESPTLFAFFSTSFLPKGEYKKHNIIKEHLANENPEKIDQIIDKVITESFKYYLIVMYSYE